MENLTQLSNHLTNGLVIEYSNQLLPEYVLPYSFGNDKNDVANLIFMYYVYVYIVKEESIDDYTFLSNFYEGEYSEYEELFKHLEIFFNNHKNYLIENSLNAISNEDVYKYFNNVYINLFAYPDFSFDDENVITNFIIQSSDSSPLLLFSEFELIEHNTFSKSYFNNKKNDVKNTVITNKNMVKAESDDSFVKSIANDYKSLEKEASLPTKASESSIVINNYVNSANDNIAVLNKHQKINVIETVIQSLNKNISTDDIELIIKLYNNL